MLKTVLRGLVPAAGVAALLVLAAAPEAARADDECGAAMDGVATCGPDGGRRELDDGIRYLVSGPGGLTLTVQPRTHGHTRFINNKMLDLNDDKTGQGIAIFGSHGEDSLNLVVQGETFFETKGTTRRHLSSDDGFLVTNGNGGSSRKVTGSVTVEIGPDVFLAETGVEFGFHGIHAIVESGPAGSNAGISINNAGDLFVGQNGIRAMGHGKMIENPPEGHLNGRIEITHSGLIDEAGSFDYSASGGAASGIHAVSEGNADVAVTVTASGLLTSKNLHGIYAETKGAAGPGGSGDVTITSAGVINANQLAISAKATTGTDNTVNVMVTGGTAESTSSTGIDTESGASTGETTITVDAGASVIGGGGHGINVTHNGDEVPVNINVAGMVESGGGAGQQAIRIRSGGSATPTTVTLTNAFQINGDILFDGGEDDTLMLNVAYGTGQVMGKIDMVETLTKRGAGTARLGGDVTFAGSTATIEDGVLILRGHLDLGASGTLTVMAPADNPDADPKLAVEVVGDKSDGTVDHGRVTAGTVNIANGEVFVTTVEGQDDAARQKVMGGITIFMGTPPTGVTAKLFDGTEIGAVEGGVATGTIVGAIPGPPVIARPDPMPDPMRCEDGTLPPCDKEKGPEPKVPTNMQEPGSAGDSDSDNNRKGFLVVSGTAMAFLLSNLFEAGAMMGWSEDAGVWPGTAAHGFSSVRPGNGPDAKGLEYQVRLLDGDMPSPGMTAPVSGMSAAVRAHLGGGFHTQMSATPKLAADGGRDAVSGSRYGLGLGWRSGVFSTDIGYSHAALDARSTFSNLEGLGELSGSYGLRHDQMQANAKLDLDAGGMTVSPSVSLFGGKVSQDGYTASSRVWLSEVPSVSQEYAGWKAGLTMGSGSSLKGMGLRWRPELRLTTMRLASGGGADEMELVQRDRAGALRIQTPARASLPRTVHALGSGVTVAGGESWSVRGGYVALLADGEFEHAAGARFRLRF